MRKIYAISAQWCSNCRQAKEILKRYDIDWVDMDSDSRCLQLVEDYNIVKLPAFIVIEDGYEARVITKILEIKNLLNHER